MEKRYQVFISSTFQDLQNARQEVSQALLRADCFPAGMELFPAADEEQFEFIKTIIDQSDYYIIISAGRYGSIHPKTGLSYTEMEYDYAVETGKPIIRLLHKEPFKNLLGEFIEQSDLGKMKLTNFREKLQDARLVKYWLEPKELLAETVFALQDIQARKPTVGWVRADGQASVDAELENARLKQQVAELELEMTHASPNFDDIISSFQGSFEIKVIEFTTSANPQPTGKDFIEELPLADIAIRACVAILARDRLHSIENFVKNRSTKKVGYSHTAMTEFQSGFSLTSLLQVLESKSILVSEPFTSEGAMLQRTEQLWYLTDDARKWISGIAASDVFT